MHGKPKSRQGFFQKLHCNNHLMIVLCVLPILILLAGSYLFGWNGRTIFIVIILMACLLGHAFMMKSHKH